MTRQLMYSSYKKKFKTVPEVMDHMKELHYELWGTALSNLQFFNITYFIITKNVFAKIKEGYFTDAITMQKLDLNFATYYFDALKSYVDGKKTTPAWHITFDFCKKNTSIPLIYLALGINAHVNNDLSFSLFATIKNPHFKQDFERVNKIIADSLDEVIKAVHLQTFYRPFMNILIRGWRREAWNNYRGLKNQTKTRLEIMNNAYISALHLTKINSAKDFYYLLRIFKNIT